MKRFISRLLILLVVMAPVIGFFLGKPELAKAKEYSFEVSTAEELSAAMGKVSDCEAGGEMVIRLLSDISLNTGMTLNKAEVTVTIIGNNHTISNVSKINVLNGTMNLGSADDTTTLTISGVKDNDRPGLLYIGGQKAICNMYDGVTLTGHTGNNYFGGGVTIDGGTFNMYGGTISKCGIQGGSVCFGGGVALNRGGTFNMYDGEITDCFVNTSTSHGNAGLIPWGAGGGVFVVGGSTFNMSGGKITNCAASETGGGVFVVASIDAYLNHHGSFGYLDSSFIMSGGEITNCSATYYGGGVATSGYYVNASSIATAPGAAGTPSNPGVYLNGGTISGNTAASGAGLFGITLNGTIPFYLRANISNNIAEEDSSDVFLQGVKILDITDPAAFDTEYLGLPSDITGKKIDGYYWDDDPRFVSLGADDRELATIAEIKAYAESGSVSLIAAANPKYVTLTFESELGNAPDKQMIEEGEIPVKPADAEWKEGYTTTAQSGKEYRFGGWYVDEAFTTPFDFSAKLNADATAYAKWIYDGYVDVVNITKKYITMDGYTGAGEAFDPTGKLSERVNFTIKPMKSFYREKDKTGMPSFEDSYSITVGVGRDVEIVTLPDFADFGTGDYWYEVSETDGTSAGVKYDSRKYYMRVQVSRENEFDSGSFGISSVKLHKTEPKEDGTFEDTADDLAIGITNSYATGSITITKKVVGEDIDADALYKMTIQLSAPKDTEVASSIYYIGGFDAEKKEIKEGVITGEWTGTKEITFYLKKDMSISFSNIPNGVTYQVAEADYSKDGFKNPVYKVDEETGDCVETGDEWTKNLVKGTVSDDEDKVVVTNEVATPEENPETEEPTTEEPTTEEPTTEETPENGGSSDDENGSNDSDNKGEENSDTPASGPNEDGSSDGENTGTDSRPTTGDVVAPVGMSLIALLSAVVCGIMGQRKKQHN